MTDAAMPATSAPLAEVAPEIDRILMHGTLPAPRFAVSEIQCKTVRVTMRDGVRLATDVYLPPLTPAPVIATRTPYGRAADKTAGVCLTLARRGYGVVAQDCRGTGDSEPDAWDYYVYESDDGVDCAEWISSQPWSNGFLGAFGGSYVGQTQWPMALHPGMSTIVPEVSGLGVKAITAHIHMLVNAYARAVGKGPGKVAMHYSELERLMSPETLAGGYFNAPLHEPLAPALLQQFPELRTASPTAAQRQLWERYCAMSSAARAAFLKNALGIDQLTMQDIEALSGIFGQRSAHDAHSLPHADPAALCRQLQAPALLVTGWYDWFLVDAIATWQWVRAQARSDVAARTRLLIAPSAHNAPGYHEGMVDHPELQRAYRTEHLTGLLLHWYALVREKTSETWPPVIYYLMGANEWRVAQDWPPPGARPMTLYLNVSGALTHERPLAGCVPDRYIYDPADPTPTLGGSILSYVYPPGSVDVSAVQGRTDVLSYTTPSLERDLDVVGPLRLVLYASSSAVDTDFSARLSDVFPDGRAIQLQSGLLRARHRNLEEPELLDPGRIYALSIDMWATANRFKAGHRLRLDIASADFPRFDRNSNLGGRPGAPVKAVQTLHHEPDYPSHLLVSVLHD